MATVKPADVTAHDLAELMVGSELPTPETTESTVTDIVACRRSTTVVVNDGDRAVVSDVSLTVHRGEVVGVAGVEGNGQVRAGRRDHRHAHPIASGTIDDAR